MTQQIDRSTQTRAAHPAETEPGEKQPALVAAIRAFVAVATLTGTGLTVADLAGHGGIHLIGAACTCIILAGLGAAVLAVNHILADRQEFYRRGQLDGWMKGWRGQEPDVDDPLVR